MHSPFRHYRLPLFCLATIFSVYLSSCKKDDVALPLPQVSDPAIPDGKDTIVAGDTVLLHPGLANRTGATYTWTVNGHQQGTDSTYGFFTDSAGDYSIQFMAKNPAGSATLQYQIHVLGKYEGGIFLVNEGWFGHDKGSINFYRYGRDTIQPKVYARENPGKELGFTTEFGAVFNGKFYIVSKQGPLVVADANTLKETGRIATLPAEGRAFIGIDNSSGLLGTADGLYRLDLSSLALGSKISGIDGDIGSLLKDGDYIFAVTKNEGLIVIKQSDYSVVKTFAGMTQGISKTADGKLWTAGDNKLLSIDPASLDTATTAMPFALADPWFAWNDGTVTASSAENAVFIARTGPYGGGGNEIYKFIPGDTNTLHTPFATLPNNQEFYGSSIRYNASANEVVTTAVQSGYGDNFAINHLYFYDASSGELKKTVAYDYYYLPGLMVFN